MKKIALGLLLSVGLASRALAWPADEKEWMACKKNAECTSVKLGCSYWQPVNKKFANAMVEKYPITCIKTVPAGPQPTLQCIDHLCAKPKAKIVDKK